MQFKIIHGEVPRSLDKIQIYLIFDTRKIPPKLFRGGKTLILIRIGFLYLKCLKLMLKHPKQMKVEK